MGQCNAVGCNQIAKSNRRKWQCRYLVWVLFDYYTHVFAELHSGILVYFIEDMDVGLGSLVKYVVGSKMIPLFSIYCTVSAIQLQ